MRILAGTFLLTGLLLLAGCGGSKVICPAYQSSFIHDKEALRAKFSYFQADSTPKVFAGGTKNKYLVGIPEPYRKKYRRLQTIEMKPVYPVLPDSIPGDTVDTALAGTRLDSLGNDVTDESGMVQKTVEFRLTQTKEKYNSDQDYYMWFFRKSLLLPDIRYSMEKRVTAKAVDSKRVATAAKAKPDKSKKSGGFLNLPFRKKKEGNQDPPAVQGQGSGSGR